MKSFKLGMLAGLAVTTIGLMGADSFKHVLMDNYLSLNLRVRYEGVEQTGLKSADAFTARTRLGYEPKLVEGWSLRLEAEKIFALDNDRYNQAGLNPGGAGRAVVADPEITELNQAWLAFAASGTQATVGRQRLVLDNERFIGDVGWRQNNQTFDAVVLRNSSWEKTTLTYFYLNRINRILGRDHAQGSWLSNSHGFNARTRRITSGTLTGYAYLLDFSNAATNSSATYGASWAGAVPLDEGLKLTYRLETAKQSDYGKSPVAYTNGYSVYELGLAAKSGALTLGFETLGTNHGVGFKTPLATGHAFNGWADMFLSTPGDGLHDRYGQVKMTLPRAVSFLAVYHKFESERKGTAIGAEVDFVLTRKMTDAMALTAKLADFNSATGSGRPDVQKIWLQTDFEW
jgi:hypothetical protein